MSPEETVAWSLANPPWASLFFLEEPEQFWDQTGRVQTGSKTFIYLVGYA
jgi:hypothetical protein